MAKGTPAPKKRTTKTKTGTRRSHLFAKLQRSVNKTSPVKVVRPRKLNIKKLIKTKPSKTVKGVKPTKEASSAKPKQVSSKTKSKKTNSKPTSKDKK